MDMDDLQGWYSDPYLRHELRWFSAGRPTALIRDGHTEGNDPPPDEPMHILPARPEESPFSSGGADLRRSDDAQLAPPVDDEILRTRASDAMVRTGPGVPYLPMYDFTHTSRVGGRRGRQLS